jgi:DeoR/GlpR family transcriptional regulator of sugar metabolism
MNKFERACIKRRILKLAKLKSTGTPSELASKFEISVRTIKRIVKEMREEGEVIRYDYSRMSYVTNERQ